jgi:hypothetical protein
LNGNIKSWIEWDTEIALVNLLKHFFCFISAEFVEFSVIFCHFVCLSVGCLVMLDKMWQLWSVSWLMRVSNGHLWCLSTFIVNLTSSATRKSIDTTKWWEAMLLEVKFSCWLLYPFRNMIKHFSIHPKVTHSTTKKLSFQIIEQIIFMSSDTHKKWRTKGIDRFRVMFGRISIKRRMRPIPRKCLSIDRKKRLWWKLEGWSRVIEWLLWWFELFWQLFVWNKGRINFLKECDEDWRDLKLWIRLVNRLHENCTEEVCCEL